jgi:hypothetical protein
VLTNRKRRRFESNSYPAGGVLLTLTETRLARAAWGHLWYNLGIVGLTDAASPRATLCQVIGTLTLPWSYVNVPKHILTSSKMRAWPFDSWPELYYSASQSKWLMRPTKCWTAFNMTQGRTTNRSLNDSDGHSFAPKTWSVLRLHYWTPVRSQFIFQHGSFSR